MKRELLIRNLSELVLSCTERYASKKANSLCHGRLYEPKIPKKLRKQ